LGEPAPTPAITVRLARDDERSRNTQAQLLRLLHDYDLKRWYFTNTILIDSNPEAIPHSLPTLTLSTRFIKDHDLLLATFLHEQLHWFLLKKPVATEAAIVDLELMYPNAPAGPPEGAHDSHATYLHLLVCYLEARALTEVVGELRAKLILEFWTTDHYRWVYRTVLADAEKLTQVAVHHGLIP
jgi:hypothetical protein